MSNDNSLLVKFKQPLRRIRDRIRSAWYSGAGLFCPICQRSSRKFLPAGDNAETARADARCPHCGSVERHRLFRVYLEKTKVLSKINAQTMLHIAPEPFLVSYFRKIFGKGYTSADLLDRSAMVKMDITDIQYPDCSFDFIYCSHVLEHVPDDRKAMREFYRVLTANGLAVLLVPITADKTYEDSAVVTPQERLMKFGQRDHVRRYGNDYVDRLKEVGFTVETVTISDIADNTEFLNMRITPIAGDLYLCRK